MMTANLRPPSSGSRSPSPGADGGRPANARASLGPGSANPRPIGLGAPLASPRPGGARPTSELLVNNVNFQTPEAEAIDQWFENLQSYEDTLEEMAAASLDVNFKEELSAIEQWFKVLSEAERTAALYSLLQHSTQVQIRFFITVLQQMARSDPMTALLSPAVGGSMQQQMEAKLAQMNLKSPGLKSGLPQSPIARNFSGAAANRQSLAVDTSGSSLLHPSDAANMASPATGADAAGVLAQKRAQLKASNAAHRISAPVLGMSPADQRNVWGPNGTGLDQVHERSGSPQPTQEITIPSSNSRPKSMDAAAAFARSPRPGAEQEATLSPMVGDSWASMVNTPLLPMFANNNKAAQNLDGAAAKLNDWSGNGQGHVPIMEDAKKFRRQSKTGEDIGAPQNNQQPRNTSGNWRSNGSNPGWNGAKSPALSNVSSNRYNSSDDGSMAGLGMAGFGGMGMGSPGLGMGMPGMGMPGMGQMNMNQMSQMNMNPFLMNMANLNAMGMTPEAQMLAAQMAAAGGFGQGSLSPFSLAGLQAQQLAANMGGRGGNRMGGVQGRSPSGPKSNVGGGKKDEEDVDPKVLEDIPGWLRSLRLHKYTPNFENANWRDMVMMDEAALEAKGVAALGARRKMLKTFEIVRKKMGMPEPGA